MFQGVGGAQALYVGKYMALSDVEGNFNPVKEDHERLESVEYRIEYSTLY